MDCPHSRTINGFRRPRALLLAVALIVSIATVPVVTASARGGAPPPAAAGLPSDWPAGVPVPAGGIQGSTGANGSWGGEVLLKAGGPQGPQAAPGLFFAPRVQGPKDPSVGQSKRRD